MLTAAEIDALIALLNNAQVRLDQAEFALGIREKLQAMRDDEPEPTAP